MRTSNELDQSQIHNQSISQYKGKGFKTSIASHHHQSQVGGNVTLPSDFWVTIQLYSNMSGYSVGALYQKINRGQLIEERHFRHSRDGLILMNVRAMQDWSAGK